MTDFSNYSENALLDYIFNSGSFKATLYFGLSTADPLDDGSGLAEPSGGAYARVAVTANATNFPAASGGSIANGTAITFPTATAGWGTVTHVAVFDAASGGNLIVHGALTASKTIDTDDTPSFGVGVFSFDLA